MENEVRFHDTHRLQAALNVAHGIRFLTEHRQECDSAQRLDEFSPHQWSETTILRDKDECKLSYTQNKHTLGVLQSGCCSSSQPAGYMRDVRVQNEDRCTSIKVVRYIFDESGQLKCELVLEDIAAAKSVLK